MRKLNADIRLGADIGGTFTDVALDLRGQMYSAKVLTNHTAPEQSIIDGINIVTGQAQIGFGDLGIVIHGTTLATNALIERKGAKTALVTSEGFRDVIEMRTESRFDQYDLNIVLPRPLISREHRYCLAGRFDAGGNELAPFDAQGCEILAKTLREGGYGAIAIGFLHSYQNGVHERAAREIFARHMPDAAISISSEVSPQMREFERFNTVCANAYVRPLMQDYLVRLQARLADLGAQCPVFLIHSGGGLMSVETACEFPVRLVESGPAGGAIFAADIGARFGLDQVMSYDMGGTTAKICMIGDYTPQTARSFEVARSDRFQKGSGMPISIPVIEMIEIGAGGGSLAWVDTMGRIMTGPESAGSEPGPACYGRGGTRPSITDADLVLGKLDPGNFAGGEIPLSIEAARGAIDVEIGGPLGLNTLEAGFGICEVVDENMANAARVHAVENGKVISENTMIAFGGAAPLHAARMCEKLGIDRCLIPVGAGVGSAIGFLKAPFGYEALASKLMRMSAFDPQAAVDLLGGLRATADQFVRSGTAGPVVCQVVAFMRYAGQGWEIPVDLSDQSSGDAAADAETIVARFRAAYARFFGRAIDGLEGLEIEIVTWSVKVTEVKPRPERVDLIDQGIAPDMAASHRKVFDASSATLCDAVIIARGDLPVGARVEGPAVIVEDETSTLVSAAFCAIVQADGALLLIRKEAML